LRVVHVSILLFGRKITTAKLGGRYESAFEDAAIVLEG
jgi:hypothetical protein